MDEAEKPKSEAPESTPSPEQPESPLPPEDKSPEDKSSEDKSSEDMSPEDMSPEDKAIQDRVIEALREIYDPEIPVDIYELGLIYSVNVDSELGRVHIEMTLTSPACPVAGSLPGEVEMRVRDVEGVDDAQVELVWDPPWNMDRLTEAAKLQMGLT